MNHQTLCHSLWFYSTQARSTQAHGRCIHCSHMLLDVFNVFMCKTDFRLWKTFSRERRSSHCRFWNIFGCGLGFSRVQSTMVTFLRPCGCSSQPRRPSNPVRSDWRSDVQWAVKEAGRTPVFLLLTDSYLQGGTCLEDVQELLKGGGLTSLFTSAEFKQVGILTPITFPRFPSHMEGLKSRSKKI